MAKMQTVSIFLKNSNIFDLFPLHSLSVLPPDLIMTVTDIITCSESLKCVDKKDKEVLISC